MNHKIKVLLATGKCNKPFTGVIQADESFTGGLNKNRHANKKVEYILPATPYYH